PWGLRNEDPKGLFVLESLAAGTPVVMPEHGAFGELVRSTEGGLLVPPDDAAALADALLSLKDPEQRAVFAAAGHRRVIERHTVDRSARELIELLS
ncbi:MAG: glycosyltransferase, partial [Planctomycetota bacterium]